MNNNIQWALDAIAAEDHATHGEVVATINALEAAGQLVVVIGDGVVPILLSIDPIVEKVFLINDFLGPNESEVQWAIRLQELLSGNKKSLWDNMLFKGALLALLIMGSGLNNLGLILEMSIYDEDATEHLNQRIIDRHGQEHGQLQVININALLVDIPVDIQIVALCAFLAARRTWNMDWLGYQIYTKQFNNLPAHLKVETLFV